MIVAAPAPAAPGRRVDLGYHALFFAPMRARVPATPLAERAHPKGMNTMKTTNTQPARATPAALLALLLLAGTAGAQPATPPAPAPEASAASAAAPTLTLTPGDDRQGTFKTVQGQITHAHGGRSGPAQVGDALWEGDRVSSGPKSAAAITLRDGTVLSIGPDSSVDLAQFQFEPTTHEGNVLIALAKGSLRLVTGLIAKLRPEQVKVTTPTTVTGVRGTDFIVEQKP